MAADQQKQYTCLIVDHESAAHKFLSFHIAHYAQLVLCGEAYNAFTGLQLIKKLKPDLIFLNLTMPVMTGFEMLDHFNTKNHYIILSTALQINLPLDPRLNDYLQVPETTKRFIQVMQRLGIIPTTAYYIS